MKSSEIIRKAIDNHLSDAYRPRSFRGDTDRLSEWLCWCIVLSFPDQPNTGKLCDGIAHLPEKGKRICDILSSETDFHHIPSYYYEIQQMRYMYADFLAYYFEDMGD